MVLPGFYGAEKSNLCVSESGGNLSENTVRCTANLSKNRIYVEKCYFNHKNIISLILIPSHRPPLYTSTLFSLSINFRRIQIYFLWSFHYFQNYPNDKPYIWFFLENVLIVSRVEIGLEQIGWLRIKKEFRMLPKKHVFKRIRRNCQNKSLILVSVNTRSGPLSVSPFFW